MWRMIVFRLERPNPGTFVPAIGQPLLLSCQNSTILSPVWLTPDARGYGTTSGTQTAAGGRHTSNRRPSNGRRVKTRRTL